MEIEFVLVEPSVPENVGSVARALKTLGFQSLILVNSQVHREEKAQWVAHGSTDILEKTRVYPNLSQALESADFIVATTARKRTLHHDYYSPTELRKLLSVKVEVVQKVALLFGREESGLTNDELSLAHCISSIPLAQVYPSLNLAQAVLVYAYELSPLRTEAGTPKPREDTASPLDLSYKALYQRVETLMGIIHMHPKNSLVARRLLERLALLSASDIRLLHSLCAQLEKELKGGKG
ncbi:MAG: tRNA/rRNA methyltransferase [Spirochaetales bacterium]